MKTVHSSDAAVFVAWQFEMPVMNLMDYYHYYYLNRKYHSPLTNLGVMVSNTLIDVLMLVIVDCSLDWYYYH